MRRIRLDETPQFFNVLKGDMSIVGPRAERLETSEAYTKAEPAFAYRLKVKTGITGYAQINGRYNTSFEDKLRMDLCSDGRVAVPREAGLCGLWRPELFVCM